MTAREWARRVASLTGCALPVALLACGPAASAPSSQAPEAMEAMEAIEATAPAVGGRMRGSVPADPEQLATTAWRYVEGTCTEGLLDMSVRGFSETLRFETVPNGFVITADRHFAEDACTQTVRLAAQRGQPETPDIAWLFSEHTRVAYPASPRCDRVLQEDAAGDVRMRGTRLELYLRRAPWCGGYEARLVYEPTAQRAERDAATTLRHFVAAFHDRDAIALAALYAAAGAHEDPHRPDETGRPTRHLGRVAVQAYFAGVFHQVPWLALRLRDVQSEEALPGEAGGVRLVAHVEYMDGRLDAPRAGRLQLDVVEGEVFASRLELQEPAAVQAVSEPAADAR